MSVLLNSICDEDELMEIEPKNISQSLFHSDAPRNRLTDGFQLTEAHLGPGYCEPQKISTG